MIYEMDAICRYVDAAFEGRALVARMTQVLWVWDGAGYRPLVRKILGRRIFDPCADSATNKVEIAAGLCDARPAHIALDGSQRKLSYCGRIA